MSVRIALNHQKQLGTSSPCPHLGIQRGDASTKFDLLDRSLEPFLPSRSPRIDASSLHTHAFPLRSAQVCARRQASDALLAENYLAAKADLGAMKDRLPSNESPSSNLWSATSSGETVWWSVAMPMSSSYQNRRMI
ncbi:hypothetical protein T07_14593 [Trichinella nelsoni]|uniref:Uncharacterized protein n=1 Tax=Trichinella nelsoni TaxID=6336 RepID=A0A0V0RFE4_9BILA|nr:hypothetical protein T07_14593 [Trichinella nelsoni]